MKKLYPLLIIGMMLLSASFAQAQCIPTSTRPVFGTVTAATGTFTFTNIPTGNVIRIDAPAAGLVYNIDMCSTNPAGTADGINDSQLTMLDLNSAAATAIAFEDDGCTTNVPNGWGPTVMTWGSTGVGTTFLYLTEWNTAGTLDCIADGLNNAYDMTITISGAGPCEAGTVNVPAIQNVCPGQTATMGVSGTIAADGDFALNFDDSQGGTGGAPGGFNIVNITAPEFPYTFDDDVNGILSANSVPPLEGTWLVKVYALDAAGFACDSSAAITVNFLDATDPLCGGSGFDAALVFSLFDEYTAVPLDQVTTYNPSCVVENVGASTVTNVQVTTNIYNEANTIVHTASNNTVASLAAGATATITDATGFTPTTAELFIAEFIVSINEADGDITNDTLYDAILITDSLYARDFATIVGDLDIQGALGIGAGGTGRFGNVYDVNVATSLVSAEVILNGTLLPGDTTRAHIYSMAGGLPNTVLASTNFYIPTQADTPVFNLELPFNPPVALAPGSYFLALEEFDNTDNIGCLTSVNNYTLNKTLGSVNGGAFADIATLGVPAQVFLVRANLHNAVTPTCAITAITAGTQSACNVTNNTYTQQVTVTYNNAPTTGMLNVNGQMFAIGTSPQSVTLSGLNSDGAPVNVTASFTSDAACTFTQNNAFTAPVACFCAGYSVTPTINDATCQQANGSISVVATGGTGTLDYSWSPGGQTTASITNQAAGNYSLTITDDNGCPETFNYTIGNVGTPPTLSFSSTDVTNCTTPNGTATVTSSNPIQTVMWSPSGQNTATATGLAAGTQTAMVTDVNGCTATGSTSVANAAGGLSAVLDNTTNVTCNGLSNGVINISISGGTAPISYTWSDVGVPSSQQDRTGLPAGSYSVTIQDGNNCSFSLGPITITQPNALTVNVNSFTNVTCNGANNGTITVTGAGGTPGLEYSKDGIVFQPSGSFTNLAPGNYTITVRDANNCTTTTPSIPITQPNVLGLTLNGTTNILCNGNNTGVVNTSASGGTTPYSYSIDGGATTQANGVFNNLAAGNYTVVVVDANGCTEQVSASITEPAAIILTVDASSDISCNGAGDGSINTTATGGSGNLTYDWGAGLPTTGDIANLEAGNYQLTVTDGNGCSVSTSVVTITEPAAIVLNVSSTPESASGANDGTATVSATGGVAPFDYAWSPGGQTASAAVGLSAGTYTVTVTDDNNCSASETVDVDLDVTSIGDVEVANVMVYPNPTTGLVTLSFETKERMDATFSVINLIGKTVSVKSANNVMGDYAVTFDLSDYPSGVYMIEMDNGSGKMIKKVTLSK